MENMENKIKERRVELGLTQKDLSNLLGIPLRTVESWDAGDRSPSDWTKKMVLYMMDEYGIIRSQKKYMSVDDTTVGGGMEIWETAFDTLAEAEADARNEWETCTKFERKRRHIYVAEVKGEYLNLDAIDLYGREVDWDGYNSYDPIGFDSDNLEEEQD